MMNERIKELAVQADNYAYKMNPEEDSYGRPANPRKFQQDRDTKFAELIVLECANVVIDSPWKLGNSYKAVDQAWLVKEHFGVEE
jgi:hypothetical protein